MKSFQQRNPVPIGVGSLIVAALVLLAGYNTEDLPLIGNGEMHEAALANAAGLSPGDPVRMAGIRVGHVQDIRLDGTHVVVRFDVKDVDLGAKTTASVQLGTILGQRFLEVDPKGSDELDGPIPLARTHTPYEIIPAINQLAETTGEIDVGKVQTALNTLSNTFDGTSESVHGALTGLSRLSTTIAKRDAELAKLLNRADQVTSSLAARDKQIRKLLDDINPLLQELRFRRDAIHQLLVGAQELSKQLSGLIEDNRKQIQPTLDKLDHVATVLQRNKEQLSKGLRLLKPYVHLFTNTVGSGRWFDVYVCNLVPPEVSGLTHGGCNLE